MHTLPTLTLYEKIGGQPVVVQIVDDFYKRVLADDTINHFFANTDMEKQRRHQTAFISHALGSPNQYTGRSMEKAHAGLDLQPEHFEAIANHLGESLAEYGLTEEELKSVLERISTLKEAVLHK